MMLGVCRKPYPDELFYGCVRAIFQKNGFRTMGEVDRILGDGLDNVHIRINYPTGISKMCDVVENVTFPNIEKAMSMTPFGALAFELGDKGQARLSETLLQSEAPCVPAIPGIEKDEIHLCPECWKEDIAQYGEGYLHLSHHLSGVKVCAKHRIALWKFKMEQKRALMKVVDIKEAIPIDIAIQDMQQEIQQAKIMQDACHSNKGMFLWSICPDCGKAYLEHSYSKRTGCGCPFCNAGISSLAIIRRRLKSMFDDEYDVETGFSSIHNAVVVHNPCGSRIRKLDALLYGEPEYCLECRKLTPERLQHRFDPSCCTWEFYENPDSERKRKRIHVRHLKCQHDFDVFMPQFSSKEGGYCPYCDNPQKSIHISEVDSDYEIAGEYKNNREQVQIRHKTCGVKFYMSKTSFLAGGRCPVCTPRYRFEDVKDAVLSHTEGYKIEKGKKRGTVTVTLPGGVVMSGVPYTVIMNDLKSEKPCIFKKRIKPYKDARSIRSVIYENVKRETFQKGYWCFKDGLDGQEVTRIRRNIVQDMARLGYIKRIGVGQYSVDKGDEKL